MNAQTDSLAVALFSEILTVDQLARNNVAKALPKGMELNHFSVLNHLARVGDERSPAQLAKTFHVTRGAMTNTSFYWLGKPGMGGRLRLIVTAPIWEHRWPTAR